MYSIDCYNPFENDCLFSIISSFIDEMAINCNIEFIELIYPNNPYLRFKRFRTYLANGIDEFNYLISMNAYDDYDVNSLDSLFSTLIIGLYYGVSSDEYHLIKNLAFSEPFYNDLMAIYNPIDIFILNATINRKYTPPIKQLNDKFFTEENDVNCYKIKNKCTIALVGNLASGTNSSIDVIKAVKNFKPTCFIHLGNVYNSGRLNEYKNNLVTPVKTYLPNTKAFIVPGNHSYYSGSQGFEYALQSFNQHASYFSIYNKNVQIQGIDTSYYNSSPSNAFSDQFNPVNSYEVEWHNNRVINAKVNGRRIIYLSHHSPVSFQTPLGKIDGLTTCINPTLHDQFANTIDDLDLWFFSQERSFNLMQPYIYNDHVIVRPRLIGNSSLIYQKENLSNFPGDFEADNNIVPLPVPIGVYPKRYLSMLNPTFTIIKVNTKQIKVKYYQLPQIEMGIYDKPDLLYQEIIEL
jgi:hypothetical protein